MQALKLEELLRLLKLELLLKCSSNELEGKIYCIYMYMLVLLYKGLHVVIVQVQSMQNTRMCETIYSTVISSSSTICTSDIFN